MPGIYDAAEDESPNRPAGEDATGRASTGGADYESDEELKKCVAHYWSEVARYEKVSQDWYDEADCIIDRYLDEDKNEVSERRFALLWANVETLKPSIYARLPTILCSRRFKDKDKVGRVAAEIMERCTNTTMDILGVDEVFRLVRDDRLLPGRGQAWVRYEADIETVESEEIDFKTRKHTTVTHDKIVDERAPVDYVYWKDFGHNVSRTWAGVWLVWRRNFLSKADAANRFGEKIAATLKYSAKPDKMSDAEAESSCCEIYEFWDRRKKSVKWVEKSEKVPVEHGPPPVKFSKFFPCPEPAYATKTSKGLIPRPDYRYYLDQAKEIDDLTAKIHNLTSWLIVKAFIPRAPSSSVDAIEKVILDSGNDEMFVTVESWQEFVEKGGAKGLIDWLPIEAVVKALREAISARNQLIQDVYQITGIADILRGQTDPVETLGAQEIKQSSGSKRLKNAKDEIERLCRDVGRLVAEVVAECFQPATLAAMSGFQYVPQKVRPALTATPPAAPVPPGSLPMPPNLGPGGAPMPQAVPPMPGAPPLAPGMPAMPAMGHNGGPPLDDMSAPEVFEFDDEVVQLLRDDRMRGFRIEVETNSTIQPDEDAEKQRRVEFLNAVGGYMEKAVAAIQQIGPSIAPLMVESLLFAARGFRAGRTLEDTIEKSIRAMAGASQQQKPDPIAQIEQAKMAQNAAQHQEKMQQSDAQHKQKMEQDQSKHVQEIAQSRELFQQKLALEREDAVNRQADDERRAVLDRENKIQDTELARMHEREKQDRDHEFQREAASQQSESGSGEFKQALAGITQNIEALAKQVAAVMDDMGAPIEVLRDGHGRLSGLRKGRKKVAVEQGAEGEA